MTIWLFAYDLRNTTGSVDYQPLWDEMDRLGAQHVQDSVWLLNAGGSAKDLVDSLAKFVHKDDRLWVSELTQYHWYKNAMGGTNAWLKENPPGR